SVGTGIAHRAPPLRCGVRACTGIRYPAAETCAAPFLAGTAGSGSAFRPPGAGEETAYTAVPGRSERRGSGSSAVPGPGLVPGGLGAVAAPRHGAPAPGAVPGRVEEVQD